MILFSFVLLQWFRPPKANSEFNWKLKRLSGCAYLHHILNGARNFPHSNRLMNYNHRNSAGLLNWSFNQNPFWTCFRLKIVVALRDTPFWKVGRSNWHCLNSFWPPVKPACIFWILFFPFWLTPNISNFPKRGFPNCLLSKNYRNSILYTHSQLFPSLQR